MRRRHLLLGALAPIACPALAQGRSIRLVAPYAAGGPMDIVARLFAPVVGEMLGTSMVVENRTGGGGMIGAAEALRAPPDGSTVLMTGVTIPMQPMLRRDAPYKVEDMALLTRLTTMPHVMMVPASLPVQDVAQFVAYAKARPGELAYASYGVGNSNHFGMELLKLRAGIDVTHVPYRGGGPAVIDMLGGRIQVAFLSVPETQAYLQDGRLRALATVHTERIRWLPQTPTLGEAGYPGIRSDNAFGIAVASAMAAPLQERIGDAFRRAARHPDVAKRLEDMACIPLGTSAEEYRAIVAQEAAGYLEVLRVVNILADA